MGQDLEKLGASVPDPARQQHAQEYGKPQRLGSLIELGIGSLLLLVLLFTPTSATLASPLVFPFSVLQPALNWYNRRIETAADETVLVLSDNPQAFVSSMTKLTDQNLNQAEPSRWVKLLFYDHPTYNERIKLARNYISRRDMKFI